MNRTQQVVLVGLLVVVIVLVLLGRSILFTVNERELAVVLQFGDPVASYTEPGLKFKLPLIQEVRRLPKTYQFWTGAGGEVLVDLPTADGKKIEVTPWAIWRITDPKQFVQVLRTIENAESRVSTFVRSEMRDVITANDLVEVVRSSSRPLSYTFQVEFSEELKSPPTGDLGPEDQVPAIAQPGAAEKIEVGRETIVRQIKETVQTRLSEAGAGEQGRAAPAGGRGIELVDVGVAWIDFVPAVREEAFQRLIAFMESIAARYTNEGERIKQEIINRTQAEVQKIEGQGSQEANRIRGEVDAEVIDAYAKAIQETGEFYNFTRTLEAYQKSLGPNTRLILTTDSAILKLLNQLEPVDADTPPDKGP